MHADVNLSTVIPRYVHRRDFTRRIFFGDVNPNDVPLC